MKCGSDAIPFPLGKNLKFPRFFEDAPIELVGIIKGGIAEMVGVFLDGKNNVRVVAV